MLWTLLACSAIVASLLAVSNSGVGIAATRIAAARAEAAAEGGIHLGARWIADRSERRWTPGAAPLVLTLGEARLRVTVEEEAEKLDLNVTGPGELARFLAAMGLAPDAAAVLADRILDQRDPDDLVRVNGAEARAYRELGLPPPRNAPFETLDEVVQTIGVEPAMLERWRPWLTIHAGRATLPAALAGEDAAAPRSWSGTAVPSATAGGRTGLPAYTIRAQAVAAGARRQVEAVVRIGTRPDDPPFIVLSWRARAMPPEGGA